MMTSLADFYKLMMTKAKSITYDKIVYMEKHSLSIPIRYLRYLYLLDSTKFITKHDYAF